MIAEFRHVEGGWRVRGKSRDGGGFSSKERRVEVEWTMRLWAAQVKAAIVAMRRAAGCIAQLEVATMQQVTTKRVLCGDRG